MGNRCTEGPPDPVLYGSRLYGGFVNNAVNGMKGKPFTALFTKPPDGLPLYRMGSGGRSVRRFPIDIFPFYRERPVTNSTIHKAAGSLVTGRSLQNGKMSMGNHHTERCPEVILYGGGPSSGFVNSAVRSRRLCE